MERSTERVKPMCETKLEFPEVVGKLVNELSVVEDADFGKEVLVRFSDGTQLSIAVGVSAGVKIDHIAPRKRRVVAV
jgi:hypothetical protein